MRHAIEPLLYARIEPDPGHYAHGLLNPKRQIQANAVELSTVNFEHGPVPIIFGYAGLQLAFDRAFTDAGEDYDRMKAADWLDWPLCFGVRVVDGGEWDAADEHGGIDFEVVIGCPTSRSLHRPWRPDFA
ncbi:hypothetical protein [Methylobacterium sp. P5_C11]